MDDSVFETLAFLEAPKKAEPSNPAAEARIPKSNRAAPFFLTPELATIPVAHCIGRWCKSWQSNSSWSGCGLGHSVRDVCFQPALGGGSLYQRRAHTTSPNSVSLFRGFTKTWVDRARGVCGPVRSLRHTDAIPHGTATWPRILKSKPCGCGSRSNL